MQQGPFLPPALRTVPGIGERLSKQLLNIRMKVTRVKVEVRFVARSA